jgi:protein involved in temperature-dependent protein secretion
VLLEVDAPAIRPNEIAVKGHDFKRGWPSVSPARAQHAADELAALLELWWDEPGQSTALHAGNRWFIAAMLARDSVKKTPT